jgi:hypothetical protein
MEKSTMSNDEKTPPLTSSKKATSTRNQAPVKVVRVGAIAASIWKRQTSTGFEYLDFSVSRSWKLKNGEREGYSQNFFDNNEEALFEVINLASRYIREQQAEDAEALFNGNIVVGEPERAAA